MRQAGAALLLAAFLCYALTGCGPSVPSPPSAQPVAGFADVTGDAPYAQAVAWCKANGLMSGVAADTFDPGGAATRACVAAALYRAAGEPALAGELSFRDVPDGAWYTSAALWAAESGLMLGYGGGSFGPEEPVTLEQLAVILARYRGEALQWDGDSTPATRAQVAAALMERLQSGAGILPPAGGSASGRLCISINGYTYTATLADTSSAAAFVRLLRQNGGTVTVAAQDRDGCEKSGPLDGSIPASDNQLPAPGDIVYRQDGTLSLCYAPATQPAALLAKLEGDLSRLGADLSDGQVSIVFSLLD